MLHVHVIAGLLMLIGKKGNGTSLNPIITLLPGVDAVSKRMLSLNAEVNESS